MENIKVTIIQSHLLWQDKPGNLRNFQEKIGSINGNTDIIILPEMFSTGFAMEPNMLAEKMDGNSVEWMKKMASAKDALIIGSLIIEENFKFTNRLLAVFPDGNLKYYDKRHLFSLAGENNKYSSGNNRLIIDYKNWKINPLICYDLRFPVWSRNQDDYDVLIYVANWPASRSFHWKILLQARAIENQAYVIGVNRIGLDGNGTPHSGDSCVFDPFGRNICTINPDEEMVKTITLEKPILEKTRKTYPFQADRDKFEIL
jgi:predicted amidohydrolase